MIFENRTDAGNRLAELLAEFRRHEDAVVLGLPRGGVIVAARVAEFLEVPLDAFPVRKLGVPGQEELAFGAVAPGGVRVLNQDVVGITRLDRDVIEAVTRHEEQVLEKNIHKWRGAKEPIALKNHTVILVDDGLATGATMRVAVRAVRASAPRSVVVAAPVASQHAVELLTSEADKVVCVYTPEDFQGVGQWYGDFRQTTDDEVRVCLSGGRPGSGAGGG